MLAGERATSSDADLHDLVASFEHTAQLIGIAAVVADVGVQVAITSMKHIGDLQVTLATNLRDCAHQLAQAMARHHSIGDIQIRSHAAHGTVRAFAAGPQLGPLCGITRAPHIHGSMLACNALDIIHRRAHLHITAFSFHQQHGFRIFGIAGCQHRVLHGFDGELVENLNGRRLHPLGNHLRHSIAGRVQIEVDRQRGFDHFRRGREGDRRFRRDPKSTFTAHEKAH